MSERRLTRVALFVLALTIAFTWVFLFAPESIGVTSHGYSLAYVDQIATADQVMAVDITILGADWQNPLDTALEEQCSACDIAVNGNTLK